MKEYLYFINILILMNYKLADEKLLVFIIKKLIKEKKIIISQTKFLSLVLNEFNQSGFEYKLSGERLRKISINKANIKVEIEYKDLGKDSKNLKICPVCGNKLIDIFNLTLDGKKITAGKKCTKCPYWTGQTIRMPRKYTFMR